jgi:uncharacterized protein with LGFP repeats
MVRDGDAPGPDPKDPPPPTTLGGAIGERWRQLGGAAWATPDMVVTSVGDGRGWWVQFAAKDGSHPSIVLTAQTGARMIFGSMQEEWTHTGRERSPLGYPTGEQLRTHDGVGWYQAFEAGVIVWHPQTGTHEVHGDIDARYAQLGGSMFGYPTTDETSTPDGRGRFNHFHDPASGGDKSIYWTAATKAHEIIGLIRGHWIKLGAERGVLGYPTSGELVTHDKAGRFQTFEHGMIVWHPDTGAHEVHGEILTRYLQIGGSVYGYPTTDETKTPDGRGRFNHFRDLAVGTDKSIYWTPETRAQEVYGLIRGRWAELGWERGHLGYPTGPEGPWPGAPGGRVQQFAGGQIIYNPAVPTGAYADPMYWLHLIREGGFKGQIEVTAHADGRVQLGGYVRSSAAVGYEYTVQSMLEGSNHMAVAFSHQGKVTSTHGSDEKDALYGDVTNPVVALNYPAFERGSLVVDENHRNRFTGTLGDIAEALVKWGVGELVLTPGTAALLVAGTELVSLVTSGSLVPGARIIDGTMWLAGPSGTLFALAADALARLATKEEPIGEAEYNHANLVFKGTLPPRTDIHISDGIGGNNRPFTYPRFDGKIVLNLGPGFHDPLGYTYKPSHVRGQVLIHELTHAWQYHNNAAAISYVGDAIWARVREDYDPGKELKEDWDWYGLEEQATIVENWYRTYHRPALGANTDFGLLSSDAVQDQAFRYIRDNIRTGRN